MLSPLLWLDYVFMTCFNLMYARNHQIRASAAAGRGFVLKTGIPRDICRVSSAALATRGLQTLFAIATGGWALK
jgi:hypothetical protein